MSYNPAMTALAPTPPTEATTLPVAEAPEGTLRGVETELTSDQVVERLGTASRRGRLPGYEAGHRSGALFRVAAFGHPVDADLLGWMREGRIEFTLRLPRRLATILGFTLVMTVWPGVYFMDQLMIQLLPSVRDAVATWVWYLPVAVLPIPWVWRSVMERARRTTRESAVEVIEKIAGELGGQSVA